LALALGACGDGDSSDSAGAEARASYPVRVVNAEFPQRQRLGETTLLRLVLRNAGNKTIPSLTVTFGIAAEGRDSKLPFGFRDPQPDLAQPDRPVWVLSEKYPRLVGSDQSAGAETSNSSTFEFGRVEPDETVRAIWELNAVKTGRFELLYEIGAGLGGNSTAKNPSGGEAGGSFAVRITEVPPETVVTDDGRVLPAPSDPTQANR
jgi:hypothetical protein